MTSLARQRLTPEQYLVLERQAECKSEYFDGEIFAMAGGSREHNLIVGNVIRELGTQLKGRPCETYPSDMRVKVTETGLYTYPDVVVVCGEPQFEDEQGDTLLNPTLIIEVLSPTTEAYVRGDKSAHYRQLASLQEYVLIAQDRVRVERYARQPDGQWLLLETTRLGDTVQLASIDCHLTLAEAYDRVTPAPARRRDAGTG
jgi:Uma2 family endonuclease